MRQSGNAQDYGMYRPELVDLPHSTGYMNANSGGASVIALEEVSLSEEAHLNTLEPGDYAVLDESGYLQDGLAAITNDEMFDTTLDYIPEGKRNDGGFYFTNGDEAEIAEAKYSDVELKTRFPDELRSYPETIHTHNVPEWYVCIGEFEMKLGNEEMPEAPSKAFSQPKEQGKQVPEEDWFDFYEFEDEVFRVDPGVYHGIMRKEDDAYVAIIRGDPTGQENWVGKWDLNGEQVYDHFEEEPNLSKLNHIEELER